MTKQQSTVLPLPLSHQPTDKTQKIVSLQQELLNTRKQLTKKQSQWQKQRNTLINKNQISSIEIIQLKQRIINLSKINQTLTNAMTNQQQTNTLSTIHLPKYKHTFISSTTIHNQTAQFTNPSNNTYTNQSPISTDLQGDRNYQQIRKLTKMISQRDGQITKLNQIISELKNQSSENNIIIKQMQQRIHQLRNKITTKQQQLITTHKQIQHLQQLLNKYSQPQSPPLLRNNRLNIEDLNQSSSLIPNKYGEYDQRFHIGNNYIGCYDADDDIGYPNQTDINGCQSELLSSQQQKLLCEICQKVYSFPAFEQHTHHCGYRATPSTRELLQRKRQIEGRLRQIEEEEEKENRRYRGDGRERYGDDDDGGGKGNREKVVRKGDMGRGKGKGGGGGGRGRGRIGSAGGGYGSYLGKKLGGN